MCLLVQTKRIALAYLLSTVEVHGLFLIETRQWYYHYFKRRNRCQLYEESHVFYNLTVTPLYGRAIGAGPYCYDAAIYDSRYVGRRVAPARGCLFETRDRHAVVASPYGSCTKVVLYFTGTMR